MSEEALIKQLHAGNNMVFKGIFDRYYLPLCSFAHRYVQDDDVVDDVVQDAFVSLWERRNSFQMVAAIKSFLYLCVKNASLNWLKHEQVHRKNEIELANFLLSEEDQRCILEDEIHSRVYEAISRLSERQREIILLTMEGLSNPEIAERLNISLNTVKTVKLRAYRVLTEELNDLKWLLLLLLFA